jgi:ribulose-5-phosphate 4-epimerase/fuculose-1-phosphate aldolase
MANQASLLTRSAGVGREDQEIQTARVRRDLVPGPNEHFLINPYGLRFDEIKASNLVTVDLDGNIVSDPERLGFNPAGFTIHSAVHAARPDVGAVLHTHTVAGVAISCLEAGLVPLNQWSLQFHNQIAYHAYEGIALDLAERERIVADLGSKRVMILRNHGLLTAGRSVAETFKLMFNLERSCKAQIAALSSGQKPMPPNQDVWELTARQYEGYYDAVEARETPDIEWDSYLRLLDRVAAGFAA